MTANRSFYEQGLKFSCQRCSVCCRRQPGFVFLTESDLASLSRALDMERAAFIGTYCRWVAGTGAGSGAGAGAGAGAEHGAGRGGRELLSLREKSNFDCILWKNGCTVYEARPVQCGTFPFWESIVHSGESWKELMKDCPGMGQGRVYSRAEIENMLARSSSEPIITRTI